MAYEKTTKLNEITGWQVRVDSLNAYIKALGETELGTLATTGFFTEGLKRAHSPATALGVLLHKSAGAVGDEFDGKTPEAKMETVAKVIEPSLTAEEVKAMNKVNAKNTITKMKALGMAEADIKEIVSHLPEGKVALAEEGIA